MFWRAKIMDIDLNSSSLKAEGTGKILGKGERAEVLEGGML